MYELMIDDFTTEYRGPHAPTTAVIDRLDVTARLGFNAIHFLPWTAWGDESVNWGLRAVSALRSGAPTR